MGRGEVSGAELPTRRTARVHARPSGARPSFRSTPSVGHAAHRARPRAPTCAAVVPHSTRQGSCIAPLPVPPSPGLAGLPRPRALAQAGRPAAGPRRARRPRPCRRTAAAPARPAPGTRGRWCQTGRPGTRMPRAGRATWGPGRGCTCAAWRPVRAVESCGGREPAAFAAEPSGPRVLGLTTLPDRPARGGPRGRRGEPSWVEISSHLPLRRLRRPSPRPCARPRRSPDRDGWPLDHDCEGWSA